MAKWMKRALVPENERQGFAEAVRGLREWEYIKIPEDEVTIFRVPGGWVYEGSFDGEPMTAVFIPDREPDEYREEMRLRRSGKFVEAV